MMARESACECGWLLPLSVMPMPAMNPSGGEEHVIVDACVVLVCPKCHRGHSFFTPDQVEAFVAAAQVRKKGGP